MSLTIASQGLSALSTLLLPLLGLGAADLYSVAVQLGFASYTGVVMGVLYNLALGRPGFSAWRRWAVAAVLFSAALGLAQIFHLANDRPFDGVAVADLIAILALFACTGAGLSVAGTIGVRQALMGHPRLLVGAVAAPNAGLLVGILATLGAGLILPGSPPIVLPALFAAVATLVLAIAALRVGGRPSPLPQAPRTGQGTGSTEHTIGLLTGVLTSTVIPMVFVVALTGLAAGTTFLAAFIAKIGNSVVSVGVNTVLTARYNWVGASGFRTKVPTVTALSGLVAAVVAVLALAADWNFVGNVSAVIAWLALVISSAMSIREINARALGRILLVKSAVDLILAVLAAVILVLSPSFAGYFGAFTVSAAVTVTAGFVVFGSRRTVAIGVACIVVAFLVLLTGT
jgi:hypothetical protein